MGMLFKGASTHDVIYNLERKVKDHIQSLNGNAILNASEDDLFKSIFEEFHVEIPELHEEGNLQTAVAK
jgi:hypothetical protein